MVMGEQKRSDQHLRISASWLLFALMCFTSSSRAELGGQPSQPVRLSEAPYIRYQSMGSDSLRVTEYLNASGMVFAVTWSGPGQPDLARLLGTYHTQFLAKQAAAARTSWTYRSAELWIETGGHMRAPYGRVVLWSACPNPCVLSDFQP